MIRLTSTSFLLPSLHSWNYLKSRYEIHFGDYGDWHSVLFGEEVGKIVWVVFLQDIFVSDKINYIHSDNRGYLAKIDRT